MDKGRRNVLGKGLRALIPTKDGEVSASGNSAAFFQCPIEKILPNGDQPRQSFDPEKLKELSETILSKGVIQPLVVRHHGDSYQIIAGERRWRAAKMAGLTNLPVIVKDLSDSEMLETALVENLQREDLNPLEEANAYLALVEEHGLSQEDLAVRVGRQRSTVANTLRLLKLPELVQELLLRGEVSMGHARALLSLESAEKQIVLARKVVAESLSVRECERLVREGGLPTQKAKASAKGRTFSPSQAQIVERLQRRLGTKVELRAGRRGGKVVVNYHSLDELDRVLMVIEGH